jgi:hypothetical protein
MTRYERQILRGEARDLAAQARDVLSGRMDDHEGKQTTRALAAALLKLCTVVEEMERDLAESVAKQNEARKIGTRP